MRKKLLLLITLIIFIISSLTLFFIISYLDPYRNELVSVVTLTTSFVLCVTSFFTIWIYFFKKIYYRGEIFLGHIFSSLRQAFFISIFLVGIVVFKIIWVLSFMTVFLLSLILIFIEMLFQNF